MATSTELVAAITSVATNISASNGKLDDLIEQLKIQNALTDQTNILLANANKVSEALVQSNQLIAKKLGVSLDVSISDILVS